MVDGVGRGGRFINLKAGTLYGCHGAGVESGGFGSAGVGVDAFDAKVSGSGLCPYLREVAAPRVVCADKVEINRLVLLLLFLNRLGDLIKNLTAIFWNRIGLVEGGFNIAV